MLSIFFYRLAILRAVKSKELYRSQIENSVFLDNQSYFKDDEMELVPNNGSPIPRWKNQVDWEIFDLVSQGLLIHTGTRGKYLYTVTDLGKNYLVSNKNARPELSY